MLRRSNDTVKLLYTYTKPLTTPLACNCFATWFASNVWAGSVSEFTIPLQLSKHDRKSLREHCPYVLI